MTIYKNYDQQGLDDQYNTRKQVPEFASYLDRWENSSRATDRKHRHQADLAYGKGPLETLDIFPAEKPGAPTLIFIHGGYWHLLDKNLFHFLAGTFVQRNVTTVVINYPLAPSASIDEIVDSCCRALQWLHKNILNYNGDPERLFVAGHSAGGHLAAMILTTEISKLIKGVISLSGLFRLEPLFLSYVNQAVQMDLETVKRNSPVLLERRNRCLLILVTGKDESEEFQAQSEELHAKWPGETRLLVIDGKNHYSILDTLIEEGSPVLAVMDQMMLR